MGLISSVVASLKNQLRCGGASSEDEEEPSSDLFYELHALQIATNFFSDLNKLGEGGFGPVYKGLLPNGQEIAVKKLAVNSRQGATEFTNEVKLLLKIQHKNLVTLFGCCVEGPEKMLVYEYLPNKSLDYFLFDKRKSLSLDWMNRMRIVTGIARGLLYLHEEAPEKIIHRDIKASNILLDDKLNPKVSDFGLARLFPEDGTHLSTLKISGTRGYMAPEYAIHGYLTVKADVFSFGILVLEIVSGRKNHEDRLRAEKADLLNYAWTLFQAGKSLELVDPLLDEYNPAEAAMCIQLGLLCCQATVADRPDINFVNLTLSSYSFTLPKPGKPAVHGRGGRWSTTGSTTGLTSSNKTNTSATITTQASSGSILLEEYSRNSISYSSMDEGR